MARPRAYDPQTVLDAAMRVFWRKGYADASVGDLVAATGLNRASLYAAYGDKAGLFEAVLDHYGTCVGGPVSARLKSRAEPKAALRAYLEASGGLGLAEDAPPGCLVALTAMDISAAPPGARARVADAYLRMEQQIAEHLEHAQRTRHLAQHADPVALARFYVGVIQGLSVLDRGVGEPAWRQATIDGAMTAWIDGPAGGGTGLS